MLQVIETALNKIKVKSGAITKFEFLQLRTLENGKKI